MFNNNKKDKILIFIPAYNVEKKIYNVVKRIPGSIFEADFVDILIINDHSNDRTSLEIEKIKKNFKYNFDLIDTEKQMGYGGVQKLAFDYAIKKEFDYTIMLHGDGQYAPEEIPRFISELKNPNLDAVFGSRMMNYRSALKGGMPLYKFLGNIFLTFIQNLILNSKISEFHSGYRSFKVETLKKINFLELPDYYHFDTEIIIKLLKNKMNVKEIYIPTYYGDEISHLKSIPYGLKVLYSTIKSKFKDK